jgi:glycogen(starch) synthase
VHRVAAAATPRDLDAFLRWIARMNGRMAAAGAAIGARGAVDVVHGHDWLVAPAAQALASRLGVPYVTTIHATEHGRHQGSVQRHPQSSIHGLETWMARRADRVIVCSHYMRGHVADVFGLAEDGVTVVPNGIDPLDLRPVGDLTALRAAYAAPDERLVLLTGRLVYEKGFRIALDALPGVIRRLGRVRFLVAGAGTHRADSRRRRAASASKRTARSSAGSATTSCTRSTGSPTCASCRRCTSRSGSSRSRPWRAAAPASWPTPAACARSCRTTTSACASPRATRARSRR